MPRQQLFPDRYKDRPEEELLSEDEAIAERKRHSTRNTVIFAIVAGAGLFALYYWIFRK